MKILANYPGNILFKHKGSTSSIWVQDGCKGEEGGHPGGVEHEIMKPTFKCEEVNILTDKEDVTEVKVKPFTD